MHVLFPSTNITSLAALQFCEALKDTRATNCVVVAYILKICIFCFDKFFVEGLVAITNKFSI
jgi:hypothetical protein